MGEIKLKAKVFFTDDAKKSFNFPITNSIRISFWLKGADLSTFSEVSFEYKSLSWGEEREVLITLMNREFLKDKLVPGSFFHLGVFPLIIANGKIVELITSS